MKKAIILFSGGLDSTTCLAFAKRKGFDCYTLSFNYNQKHHVELDAAEKIATLFNAKHRLFNLDIHQFGGSALTDQQIPIAESIEEGNRIPATYVPARNTIFLSIALAYAETLNAKDIFIGVSQIDYSNYPDCRPEFINAFQSLANLGTKFGIEEGGINIHTPLIHLSKAETIKLGIELGVDYRMTISCYRANDQGQSCGKCASCLLRKKGFREANKSDPTCYYEI